jgi:hypothetical protein
LRDFGGDDDPTLFVFPTDFGALARVRYEIEQIRKSFEAAKLYFPKMGDIDAAAVIHADSYAPLDAFKAAADAHDRIKFNVEFDKLTAACKAHQATHFGFIDIKVPTASPCSNQVFFPARKKPAN